MKTEPHPGSPAAREATAARAKIAAEQKAMWLRTKITQIRGIAESFRGVELTVDEGIDIRTALNQLVVDIDLADRHREPQHHKCGHDGCRLSSQVVLGAGGLLRRPRGQGLLEYRCTGHARLDWGEIPRDAEFVQTGWS